MDLSHKRILVTGANGQLGSAIVTFFKQNKIDVIGTDRAMMDITNQHQVFEVVKQLKPQVIIHCAAYTAVDKAEDDKENCYRVNVDGTRNLAQISKELNIEFVYFSTDYVFDGTKKEPYLVTDTPNPINYYGLTKYLGEEIVKTTLTKFFIFRISWVFGPNGNNFVNTISRLAKERLSINVVNDQIGSPTYTIDVAYFLINSLDHVQFGIHHLRNEGFTSWFDYARQIIELIESKTIVNPIPSTSYQTKAKRSLNSRLNSNFSIKLPDWRSSLKKYINSYFLSNK
jgi:dTDP-4-dehydrorhamnose reductase